MRLYNSTLLDVVCKCDKMSNISKRDASMKVPVIIYYHYECLTNARALNFKQPKTWQLELFHTLTCEAAAC